MSHIAGSEYNSLANSGETQPILFEQLDEDIGEPKGIYDERWARRTGALVNNYQWQSGDDVDHITKMIERKLECLSNKPLNSSDLRNIVFTPTPEIYEFIKVVPHRVDGLSGLAIIDTTHMDEVFRHMGLQFIPRTVALAVIEKSIIPKEKEDYYSQGDVVKVGTMIYFKPELTLHDRLESAYYARGAAEEASKTE